MVAWLLSIGWIPVAAEMSLNYFFHIEQRFEAAILVIPYMEFITMPLTFVAALITLYKGVKATIGLFRHDETSN